jgi:hypothetical protein
LCSDSPVKTCPTSDIRNRIKKARESPLFRRIVFIMLRFVYTYEKYHSTIGASFKAVYSVCIILEITAVIGTVFEK